MAGSGDTRRTAAYGTVWARYLVKIVAMRHWIPYLLVARRRSQHEILVPVGLIPQRGNHAVNDRLADFSREDQRRMREIVNLFTQSESRDELGIGQVRDAFSDSLFPGTSTLHTRARY